MKIVRYRGYIIGWTTTRRKYLIDALTARAIRKGKSVTNDDIWR